MGSKKNKKTEVVNKYHEEFDVYIGRGSAFGNKYPINESIGDTRKVVIEKYKKWFYKRLENGRFKKEVLKLKGKRLACFCKPLACHGDIIVEYLEKNE